MVLSSCYVETDRTIDDTNGLTIGDGGQNFDIVITTPPPATVTPTPTTASQQINWADWDFSADTATSQPSTGVQPTSASGSTTTATVPSNTSATPTPTTPDLDR